MKISTTEYTKTILECYQVTDLKLNALGLCAEAGEFANKVKKRSYEDEFSRQDIPVADMVEELADVMWHLAQCADLLDTNLDELMRISMYKTIKKNEQKK